jgi:hypothetical protein
MRLKQIKLKKSSFRDYYEFIHAVGAVQDNYAYPQCVYVSNDVDRLLYRNTARTARKELGATTAKGVQYAVGLERLNIGPNLSLGDFLKRGTVLVDEEELECLKRESRTKARR